MSARIVGELATRALLREIETWPKPGLVSLIDSGSHRDMDAALLARSAQVLRPYFISLARAGTRCAPFATLQRIGRAAERAMLDATGGINTHRGAIFGLGLLCAAAGLSSAQTAGGIGQRTRASLGQLARRQWGTAIATRPTPDRAGNVSHGAIVQRRHGVGGARAEAAGGFATLYRVALPALRQARRLAPGDANAARVHCCLALMAQLDDTNILFRGGSEGLALTRTLAQAFIAHGGVGAPDWQARALHVHRALTRRALSPGGCADLLAMTLFVDDWVRWRRALRGRCTARDAPDARDAHAMIQSTRVSV
ncbi:MAG TPA: triphosphoribosyl-dephospho-CoA synthase MdcB [Steroidobacteraceae bacterium]|nr:triphosphoribosyl-dephospho-CoA synthase MdcB [Steroidobacteraceae bacterium]